MTNLLETTYLYSSRLSGSAGSGESSCRDREVGSAEVGKDVKQKRKLAKCREERKQVF